MKAANKSLAGVVMVESDLGMGSGFFIARDKIATNIHVVAHGDISITRVDDEMRWEVAGVTAFDVEYDTIILKVREESSPLLLGNSDAVKLGDEVTVVGCSDGKYSTVPGVIHSLPRSDGWILIGAGSVIFDGNSGGPVLNSEDHVIGIVCVGNDLGTAVAIPINRLMTLLRRSGSSERLAEWHKRDEIQAYVHLCQGQAKMRQGEKKRNAGDYENAVTEFKKAMVDFDRGIRLNTDFREAYYSRGAVELLFGRAALEHGNAEEAQRLYIAAVEDLTRVVQINSEHSLAYQNRADAKMSLGQLEDAADKTEDARCRFEAAIIDYERALRINPEFAPAYSNRGVVALMLGKLEADDGDMENARRWLEAAIIDHERALRINPEFAPAYNGRGVVALMLGKLEADDGDTENARRWYRKALEDFKQAVKINAAPQYTEVGEKLKSVTETALQQL